MSEQNTSLREFELDESQRQVVSNDPQRSLAVIGAPGSGRTTTLIELVARRIDSGYRPEEIIAVAANRKLAADLRDRIEQRVRVAATGGTLGRTAASLAIEIIAEEHARRGEPAPKLITGSQQDDILADLVAGLLDPDAPGVGMRAELRWPDWFKPETLELAGFRAEMRALLTGMVEEGITPDGLRSLALDPNSEPVAGTRHRALWLGAAHIAEQYFDVLDHAFEGAFDSAQALNEAAQMLLEREGYGLERRVFDRVRLVAVDDSQELTEPARRLVRAFERRGAQVVTFGDPDIATGAFHGGRAHLAVNWRDEAEAPPERVELGAVHRHGPTLRGLVQRASAGLGSALAGTQRRTESVVSDFEVETDAPQAAQIVLDSEANELSVITGYLRRLHLLEQIDWDEMAVITRSGSRLPSLARSFDRAHIPTTTSTPLPAAEDATVRAIIALGEAAVAGEIMPPVLQIVLASPLFGLDPLELRRMRRAHYLADLSGEGRAGAQVMTDTVNARLQDETDAGGEATLEQLEASHGKRGAKALRTLTALLQRMTGRLRSGDPIDTALYEAWRDDKRAQRWQEIALGTDEAAVAMNRRLDALTVLFDRAKRFVEREPHASLAAFLTDWQRNSVVDDSLAGSSGRRAVTLTTPAGAVGRQWKVVVVAGVNEGVWPNLKVRDSLLGASRLGEASGDAPLSIIDRRAEVLADETRMIVASLSRASERVLVTAVSGEDTQPSRYLRTLALEDLPARFSLGTSEQFGYDALSLEGLAAVLRRDVVASTSTTATSESEFALARLARAGVPGAHPITWFGVRGRSTEAPLVALEDGELRLRLYPSGIDSFFECGVNWFVDQYSGSSPSDAMTIGNILHLAAENEAEFTDRDQMMNYAEQKLREMNFDAQWVEEIQVKMIRDAAESLWTYLRRAGASVVANEFSVKFDLDRELESGLGMKVSVSGRIDRIEQTEAGLRIIDIKTSATKPRKADVFENRQLRAYQLAHLHGVLPSDAQALDLESAALLFPRIPAKSKGTLWSIEQQNAFSAEELELVEDNFLEAALGEAGFPMMGLDPDLDAAPTYLSDHEKHCLVNNRNCRIHATAEVTE